MVSAAASRPLIAPPSSSACPATPPDWASVARELAVVADYVTHLKREIGALRAHELYRDRIPKAHQELGGVVTATASATHTIMAAAEEILGSDDGSLEGYQARVRSKLMEIFEACAFQDITGQRIARVLEALAQLERRLGRFVHAVRVRDGNHVDPEEALHEARRDVLILNGPVADGEGIAQEDIDKLFG
jgi:chemotaxis protein CheZ